MNEQEMEDVLNALGAVEPSPGMQDRVLRRLAQAEQPVVASGWSRSRWMLLSGLAIAGAVLAGVALYPHTRAVPVTVARTVPAPRVTVPRVAPPPAPRPAVASLRMEPIAPAVRVMSVAGPAPVVKVARNDSASLPSQLAPEAPLTVQEAMLLRVAHHPDRDAVAALNPRVREEVARRSAAEFDRYFPAPTQQDLYQQIYKETYLENHADN